MSAVPLSVLVPVYNCAPYLEHAVDSILTQDFEDIELVLIDDGSTDASRAILSRYQARESRVRVFHQPNAGVATALNNGLAECRGRYIRRVDADDILLDGVLGEQFRFLELHPEVALVSTQIAFMTECGKAAWHHRMPPASYFSGASEKFVLPEDFRKSCPIVHATVMARREALLEVGGYRSEFVTSEDHDLWLRVLEHHQAVVMSACGYLVRINSSSTTKRHAASLAHYRNLALAFHDERVRMGSDPLQRGEPMPPPPEVDAESPEPATDGGTVRSDLDFMYRLCVDARDWVNGWRLAREALRCGWRRRQTYRLLVFPLLGRRIVGWGVSTKAILRRLLPCSGAGGTKG